MFYCINKLDFICRFIVNAVVCIRFTAFAARLVQGSLLYNKHCLFMQRKYSHIGPIAFPDIAQNAKQFRYSTFQFYKSNPKLAYDSFRATNILHIIHI